MTHMAVRALQVLAVVRRNVRVGGLDLCGLFHKRVLLMARRTSFDGGASAGFFISWPIGTSGNSSLLPCGDRQGSCRQRSPEAKRQKAHKEKQIKLTWRSRCIFDMFCSPGKKIRMKPLQQRSGLRMGIDFGSNCAERVRRRLHPSVCIPRDVVNGNASVENSAERQKRRGARRTTTRTAPHTPRALNKPFPKTLQTTTKGFTTGKR